MAIMHPPHEPKYNDSHVAEPIVYRLLKEQLDDNFQIIHSIPWLSSFIHELHNNKKYDIYALLGNTVGNIQYIDLIFQKT